MKVLFLTNIPSPYRVDFFNELGKCCDLTVLFERASADNRQWQSNQNENYEAIFLKGRPIGNDMALCFEIKKYLNKSFDRIIIGGYSTPTGMLAIQILKMKRMPFYLNCDGGIIRNERKINYLIKKYFISSAAYWLSSGNETNKYLEHYGAKKDKIYIYPFTSLRKKDILKKVLTQEEKNEIKKELGIEDKKIVICVGQMIHRKGIDILLKAASKFPDDVYTYIVGGKPTDEYKKIIRENKLTNIRFLNFMCKDILYKYYQIADIFVLPTREDIWGLVINEAMANGLPVITTDKCIAGMELVKENGYIIPSNDVLNISNTVNKLFNNSNELALFSKKSLENIKSYNIENMAKSVFKIIEEISDD